MWRGQIFWKKSAGYWGDIEKKICDAAMICEGIKFFEKKFRPKLCYVKGSNLLKKINPVLRWYWNFFKATAMICEGIKFIENNRNMESKCAVCECPNVCIYKISDFCNE